nr:hypothetical protein [Serinicoccus marinus]
MPGAVPLDPVQQRGVLAAQVGRAGPHPGHPVPPCHVADEVVQRLRHPGAGDGGQLLEHPVGGPPQVQRAAHALLAEAVHARAAARLHVADEPHERPCRSVQPARRDRGEVGLQQHVVDGRRDQGLHEVGGTAGVTRHDRPARSAQRPPTGDPGPLRLAQHGDEAGSGVGAGGVPRHPQRVPPPQQLAQRVLLRHGSGRQRGEGAQRVLAALPPEGV